MWFASQAKRADWNSTGHENETRVSSRPESRAFQSLQTTSSTTSTARQRSCHKPIPTDSRSRVFRDNPQGFWEGGPGKPRPSLHPPCWHPKPSGWRRLWGHNARSWNRLEPELGRTPPAAIGGHAKKETKCGDSARCYATSASPRKPRRAHGKTCYRRPTGAPGLSVLKRPNLFGCLTPPQCILYAGCPVNAHLPHSRVRSTHLPSFRLPHTFSFPAAALRPLPFVIGSSVFGISLANRCSA